MSEKIILCKEIKNKLKKYCIFEDCKKILFTIMKVKLKVYIVLFIRKMI